MLERNKKKLHRVATNKLADWQGVSPAHRNAWQTVAAYSYGLATVGNILTVAGLALVVYGLLLITSGHELAGAGAIALGRVFDYLDGIAADMTKTKSRLGASMDEVSDAVALGIALVIFMTHDLLPLVLVFLIGIPKVINAFSWIICKIRMIRMDTTAQSKVATFLLWCGIILYLLHFEAHSPFNTIFTLIGVFFAALGGFLTIPSSITYLRGSLAKKS